MKRHLSTSPPVFDFRANAADMIDQVQLAGMGIGPFAMILPHASFRYSTVDSNRARRSMRSCVHVTASGRMLSSMSKRRSTASIPTSKGASISTSCFRSWNTTEARCPFDNSTLTDRQDLATRARQQVPFWATARECHRVTREELEPSQAEESCQALQRQ
jgi:hypothetical protein